MATRSRTNVFMRYRDTLRTHKRGPRTNTELKEFKVHKNLLAAQSDDEGSTVDARVYTVPPAWVTTVDDMNRDISQIKIKISELTTMSGKKLLPGFADDDEDDEDQIKSTEADITTLFRECEKRLREMGRTKTEGTTDEQTLQLVMAERQTEEREKAINQVTESVGELAEIFKEIQVLVIDQGTILDRIDYNIEQAADRVGNAVVELNKANEYQKKSRTMLCIYILLLLCGFMVIVLILKKAATGGR